MSHHIIRFENISFSYPDGNLALNDISFEIKHGDSVGIVGGNGAGKSTLLMQMNGSLLPDSGRILIGDIFLTRKTRNEIRKKVGLVMQNPDDQLFLPTVFEDILFGPLNLGLTESMAIEKATKALETVGLIHLKDRAPHHLSSGEKSAVAIASIMAMEPDILIMDEPASNLDPQSRRRLINMLKKFSHSKVIASHDLDFILDLSERTILLNKGSIVADGKSADILRDKELLESNGLELPLSLQKRA